MVDLRNLIRRFAALAAAGFLPAVPIAAQTSPSADDAAALAACGVCTGVMLLVPVLVLILSIVIGVWIYRDSQRRGDPQAVLWAMIGVLFNILGLIIYLIARPKTTGEMPPPPPPPPPAV